MQCPNCHQDVADGETFCINCGWEGTTESDQDAPNKSPCPDCSAQNPPDALVCGLCGRKLREAEDKSTFSPESAAATQPMDSDYSGRKDPYASQKPKGSSGLRTWAPLIGIAVVVLAIVGWKLSHSALGEGDKLPAFSLPDLSGERVSVSGETEDGEVLALVYFTTWCRYCHKAVEEVPKVRETLTIRPILIARGETAQTVQTYIESKNIPADIPILIDQEGVYDSLGGRGVPFTVLVRDGVIQKVWAGYGPGHFARQAQAAGAKNR